jgi:signal transduction histidine kinase
MSHELRTPLNHIIGFTELAADARAEYLGHVRGAGRHLLSLVNDILDLSKVEAGKLALVLEEVDLLGLLQDCLTEMDPTRAQRERTIATDFQSLPRSIRADAQRLRQVLINLLSNALKFTPPGGRVEVTARSVPMGAGEGIEVSVADTGIGLASEDLERIFHPFEQVEQSASRKFSGTGLGLSLSRQLLQLLGGRIWAESEGLGRGSTFHFLLPLTPVLDSR